MALQHPRHRVVQIGHGVHVVPLQVGVAKPLRVHPHVVVIDHLVGLPGAGGRLLDAGLSGTSGAFVAIVAAVALTATFMALFAGTLIYESVIRPARLVRDTRYLVTDRRVLIQRGHEELHLDRDKIVDVINAPTDGGLHNVFLVLDGPRARALAASGAFGERKRSLSLRPVFLAVLDAEGVSRILGDGDLSRAA